jgi:HD-like signal output (HDOD) protein
MEMTDSLQEVLRLLLDLQDLDEMGDVALLDLARDARRETLRAGESLSADAHLDRHVYLVEGEVELLAGGRIMHRVEAGTERARAPLFRVRTHGLVARPLGQATLLSLDQATFESYRSTLREKSGSGITVEEVESDDVNAGLIEDIRRAFYHREVDLPTLPELAMRINSAVQNPDADFRTIAATIAADPVIAARTVQVANSAMYAGIRRVESVQQAITRIGLQATRAIVMTVVMKNLYQPVTPLVQQRMREYYRHSIRVAAISHALAARVRGFDPERAFLAGLIHDIGVLPLLIHADRRETLSLDAAVLEQILRELASPVGKSLLKQWDFETDLCEVAGNADNWRREIDQADYCDIVQLAQLHCTVVGGKAPVGAPPLQQLPAFHRVPLDQIDPLQLVEEARKEIQEIVSLLAA